MDQYEITPWNPSKRATKRVKNPLPLPTTCNVCGTGEVEVVSNSVVYGREYGEWPWMCHCKGCGAYVGLHPFTGIPLGTLADKPTREARKRVKSLFNPLWQGPGSIFDRNEAYKWLAGRLNLSAAECHFGLFDVQMCEAAEAVLRNRTKE